MGGSPTREQRQQALTFEGIRGHYTEVPRVLVAPGDHVYRSPVRDQPAFVRLLPGEVPPLRVGEYLRYGILDDMLQVLPWGKDPETLDFVQSGYVQDINGDRYKVVDRMFWAMQQHSPGRASAWKTLYTCRHVVEFPALQEAYEKERALQPRSRLVCWLRIAGKARLLLLKEHSL
jgi:hypothetical protein